MSGNGDIKNLLKISGYSNIAIEYFFLTIEPKSRVIKEAKFQAIGCAGAFSSGSALTEMIKGKTIEQAEKIEEEDVIDWLGGIPQQKIHCTCLAKKTLKFALNEYKD